MTRETERAMVAEVWELASSIGLQCETVVGRLDEGLMSDGELSSELRQVRSKLSRAKACLTGVGVVERSSLVAYE